MKEDDQWDDGWKVISCSRAYAEDEMPNQHRDVIGHLERTGDRESLDRKR